VTETTATTGEQTQSHGQPQETHIPNQPTTTEIAEELGRHMSVFNGSFFGKNGTIK
jgi:hypothetical protein